MMMRPMAGRSTTPDGRVRAGRTTATWTGASGDGAVLGRTVHAAARVLARRTGCTHPACGRRLRYPGRYGAGAAAAAGAGFARVPARGARSHSAPAHARYRNTLDDVPVRACLTTNAGRHLVRRRRADARSGRAGP